ncbi:glycosyltransferase [Bradyrhizobium sp. CSA112]|uniref:glycosyltransferase n=1 Tax=Bradyrhizobium sp. CSA112 TaxID=2699170 RepID=UPI0023B1E305|nr:glycosyltransferase [Bradyrhizobium sp. CSA112]MDE5453018.1 glycosyltransferase [Bradyrhizobium sp. CSA112]
MSALAREADIVFGGIGYAADTSNLRALERRVGRFDVIVGQTWMFGAPGAGQYGAFVPRDLRDYPAPKVLNLLQVDPYAIPEYIYESCVRGADAVVSTVASPQYRIPDPCAATERESWFDPGLYMVRHPELIDERWLMLPHCAAEAEFVPHGAVSKRWDAIVPGIGYRFRKEARDHLASRREFSLASLDSPLQRFLYWATSDYRVQRHIDLSAWFHSRFRNRIAASRVGITCDGSVGYAIRKFFEIPAFGTLLVARFFPDMGALGFKDEENCFAVDDHSLGRLNEVLGFAKSDSREAVRILNAGQEMIRERHSATVRARQFLVLLEALCLGKLSGTRWRDGQQIILASDVTVAL